MIGYSERNRILNKAKLDNDFNIAERNTTYVVEFKRLFAKGCKPKTIIALRSLHILYKFVFYRRG